LKTGDGASGTHELIIVMVGLHTLQKRIKELTLMRSHMNYMIEIWMFKRLVSNSLKGELSKRICKSSL